MVELPAPKKVNKKMRFDKIKSFSRVFFTGNNFKALRDYATRKKAPELPTSRGDSEKISGFGKFLFVI